MQVPSSPSTPQNTNPSHAVRRSFTAPPKSKSSPSSILAIREAEAEGAETLFAHHACRIVSFNLSSRVWRRHSSLTNRGSELSTEPVGILPWASTTETTVSTGVTYQTGFEAFTLTRGLLGPLRIYRVRGSVAFLSSGSTLRPILAKSQCWCVDGESKFVLPIGDHSYYRIELPNKHPEDTNAIEEFKGVLEKILKYEKTPCPFKREFTVELPEPPETPVRLRPWKPRQRPQTQSGSPRRKSSDHMMKAMDNSDFEDLESLETSSNDTVTEAPRQIDIETNYADNGGADTINNTVTANYMREPGIDLRRSIRASHRYAAISENIPPAPKNEAGRTVTAPPHLVFQTKSPLRSTATIPVPSKLQPKLENESISLPSSVDSFHSFHSSISPLPPSPPYSTPSSPSPKLENGCSFVVPRTRAHQYDLSETMDSSKSPEGWDLSRDAGVLGGTPALPKTPTLVSDDASQSEDTWPDVETPSPLTQLRQRRSRSRRSTQSPLPSPANLYSPTCQLSGHHLTTAILQKTCSLLLGPPVQLVALMLNIASKIAKGTFRGAAYGYSESGQRIPCSWNFSDSEDDAEPSWEEDDYGVSLGSGTKGTRHEPKEELGGTWEID